MTRALLVHQPIDGGVARHVSDLFEGLTARGYEVVLCGPARPSPSLLGPGRWAEAPHVRVPMVRAISPVSDARAVTHLVRAVRALKPDLIHSHSSKAGAVARLGRPLYSRVPVLYTPHGFAFAGFFERELERKLYREAERALSPLTTCTIAVCDAEARLARTVTASNRVRVVHNGIDPPPDGAIDPRVRAIRGRGPVIGTVTQLRPGKGLETLIDALPVLGSSRADWQLAIAGDGPLQGQLRERIERRRLQDRVHFLGEHPDPVSVLRGLDIFVLTSWAESFPYVILEAMSVGVPIISSDVGGIGEALDHGVTGLLVPVRDPAATARALSRLIDDAELRAALAAAARERVSKRFTRDRMVDGVAAIYEQLTS